MPIVSDQGDLELTLREVGQFRATGPVDIIVPDFQAWGEESGVIIKDVGDLNPVTQEPLGLLFALGQNPNDRIRIEFDVEHQKIAVNLGSERSRRLVELQHTSDLAEASWETIGTIPVGRSGSASIEVPLGAEGLFPSSRARGRGLSFGGGFILQERVLMIFFRLPVTLGERERFSQWKQFYSK